MLPARKLGLWLLEGKRSLRSKWDSYGRNFSLSQEKKFVCPDGFLHQMLTASGHAAFSSVGGANHSEFLWHWILHLVKRGMGSGGAVGSHEEVAQEPHAPNPCLLRGDSVGTRECWMPGKVWAPWSFVRTVWPDTLSKLGLLSLQSGRETAEKSNHLLCLYLALEGFVWRQSNENHPKEVLCWWENYERPKKGVIKKFAVQDEL